MSFGGAGGGSGSIASSSDVVLNNPSDNQVLSYNATTYKWQNKSVAGGGTLTLESMAPGTSFDVVYDGTDWKYGGTVVTARPTTRPDLIMQCVNAVDSTVPSWAVTGDRLLRLN